MITQKEDNQQKKPFYKNFTNFMKKGSDAVKEKVIFCVL